MEKKENKKCKFVNDVNGNVFGYVSGMMTYDIMESIIQQTMEGVSE